MTLPLLCFSKFDFYSPLLEFAGDGGVDAKAASLHHRHLSFSAHYLFAAFDSFFVLAEASIHQSSDIKPFALT